MPSTIFFSAFSSSVLAVFHPAADQLAGNSAEILVTGIGQKTWNPSACRQSCREAQGLPRGHLLCHSGLVVIEPPGASLLDLAHRVSTLEASDDGSDRRVVDGIQGVEDRPGKLVGIRQLVEEIRQLPLPGAGGNAVETRVRSQQFSNRLLSLSRFGTVMELHNQSRRWYSLPRNTSRFILY